MSSRRARRRSWTPAEARTLLDSIDVSTPVGLRDRALIGLMVYSLRAHRRRARHEGRGRLHAEPSALGTTARERRQGARDALPPQSRGFLHAYHRRRRSCAPTPRRRCSAPSAAHGELTRTSAAPARTPTRMIRRRAARAGIETMIGNHSFRATGITAYLKIGGTLENAARWRTMPARARRSSTTGGTMK